VNQRAVRFADEAALIAVARDAELARAYMRRYLGGWGDSSRDTVIAYLASGQNAVAAAHRLGCGRRTVERRLAAVERALGGALREHAGALDVAVRLERVARTEGWWP